MYEGDTFFHLTIPGRAGLVFLSAAMGIITVYLLRKLSSRFVWPVKVLFAIVFLWLFVWISPQVYYFYYLLLFEGLPLQIVVGRPPTVSEIFEILTFTGDASLSGHGKGLLGWALLATVLITRARNRDP